MRPKPPVHATRRYLQGMPKDNLVAKLDFRSGFNSLMRNQMLDAVAACVAPDIYLFCFVSKASEHSLRNQRLDVI